LRDPPTPYHFRRYDDVPADQQNRMATRFLGADQFIPLAIAPGSYLNFGGELRERVEHFSNPFFGLTQQGTRPRHAPLVAERAICISGDTFRTSSNSGIPGRLLKSRRLLTDEITVWHLLQNPNRDICVGGDVLQSGPGNSRID